VITIQVVVLVQEENRIATAGVSTKRTILYYSTM